MGINLFIFDWSGVISDDRRPVYEANMRILREHGKPVMGLEEWLPRTILTLVGFLKKCRVYGKPEKLFALYKKYFDEAVKSGMVPEVYPDVHKVFQYLKDKGKKLAVLSSHPTENLIKEVGQYGLKEFLDLILGDSEDKVKGLLDICKGLDKKPESSLYIGDTIYDIRAAKGAGLHSAGIFKGYHTREMLESENPDFVLECLSDLMNLKE